MVSMDLAARKLVESAVGNDRKIVKYKRRDFIYLTEAVQKQSNIVTSIRLGLATAQRQEHEPASTPIGSRLTGAQIDSAH